MGRHSKFDDDTTTVDVIPVVPEEAKVEIVTPEELIQMKTAQPEPRHRLEFMFKGFHHTDELPKVSDLLTTDDVEQLREQVSESDDEQARHAQLLKQRERFIVALWALFLLGLILGGLCLAIWLTDYSHGGCPVLRPGLPA